MDRLGARGSMSMCFAMACSHRVGLVLHRVCGMVFANAKVYFEAVIFVFANARLVPYS